jgi:hypothetical protein
LSTRDTVLWETPAAAAMSRIVVTWRRPAGGAEGSIRGPGPLSGVDPGVRAPVDIATSLASLCGHTISPGLT